MKVISLTQGRVALVSDRDWPLVRKFKWYAVHYRNGGGRRADKWYAQACVPSGHRNPPRIQMHQLVMGGVKHGDHRNGDGLDNRRSNLRPATRSQNLGNRGKTNANTSGLKGVTWDKNRNKWMMQCKCAGIKHTSRHDSKLAAARAYKIAAKKLFGRFART